MKLVCAETNGKGVDANTNDKWADAEKVKWVDVETNVKSVDAEKTINKTI